ncbi:MAG: bifunctional nuclease family protein [Dehalococcoidia bacterium]|nr:bifunctional nuclease family protein [Dehalococcoidia bacterium]MCA9849928.1 bifunctional nuclease family protein [Dehalococcoidia bacterium]MCA9857162.1 bifunctional nuclease family protein [Dehalococcoidia bacterium]MCB9482695.1 bifunctional nuclease family protein [Dehalococcoidia bacterium]
MRELIIDSIRVGLRHYRRVVVLKEKDADRYITIWIGSDVADAIAVKLQDVTVPRPQSHDLMLTLVNELGGELTKVSVTDLREDTFFATLHVQVDGREIEVDSRPSDAIALAVRAGVPIYASEDVLDRAGIILDEVDDEEATEGGDQPTPPTQEELEKLAVFRDFVAGLDLDDLGKSE